jgi:hypothetical protein
MITFSPPPVSLAQNGNLMQGQLDRHNHEIEDIQELLSALPNVRWEHIEPERDHWEANSFHTPTRSVWAESEDQQLDGLTWWDDWEDIETSALLAWA